ncbi:hypothetical protein H0A36_21375 [Endozoicomonas sp. SM1973]|uniref:Uncharacterized protein n=1 Tax=Spartinivicinus marinus TaxID=2994442 RepID=A0A853I3R1_9GAMM|nr:hypothetical protein [Spartinivicinus marinus]MCX4027091.1 hypothetical protein [Spartinivicinus marinus]NYZ68570.1 hypothetical protein [Spartinivicinus marinus]
MISSIVNNQSIHWVAVKDIQCFSIVIVFNQQKYFIQLMPSVKDNQYYRWFLQGRSLQPLPEKRIQSIVKRLNDIAEQTPLASKSYHCDQWGNLTLSDEKIY